MNKLVTLLFFIVVFTFVSLAQSGPGKADKEFELGAYQKASESYLKDLKKNPEDVEAMNKLATCYYIMNEMDAAVRWFEKSSRIKNLKAEDLLAYGKSLQAQGAYAKAANWFLNYAEGVPEIGQQLARNCAFAKKMKGVKSLFEVKPEYLNTDAAEFAPAFFMDKVVFASSRNDLNPKGNTKDWTGSASNRLFISGIDKNGFLTKPELLRAKIKNAHNEGPLSYAENANLVCYTKNNFTATNRQIPAAGAELSLYLAQITASGDWEGDKPFPYNGSGYSTGYPCFADDGNTLYFASDRPDGFGGFDIYVSSRIGDTWSVPENLGPTVNTAGNEISPFRDGEVLYFSSDFSQGLGGFDIFKATGSGINNFTKVFHLGNEINSSYDDYSFIFNAEKNRGYFCSNRPGKGSEDLYRVTKITDNFVITILNEQNQPMKGVTVDLRSCKEKEFFTDASGQVVFQALKGFNCEAIIRKPGYESVAFNIRSSGSTQAQNVELVLKKSGADAAYVGRVVDSKNGLPKEGVYVAATNLNDGTILEMLTNSNGEYFLDLKPEQKYSLKFSMIGYTEATKEVSTGDGTNRGILGQVSFDPSVTAVAESNPPAPAKQDNPTPVSKPETPAPASNSSGNLPPVTYSNSKSFSVQIAAINSDNKVNLDIYKDAKSLGNLYVLEEKGKTKIRVGAYNEYEMADEMRQQLVKLGYKRAFIVKELMLPTSGEIVIDSEKDKPYNNDAVIAKEETKYVPATSIPAGGELYMVRLASYKNPKYFNPSKVEHFGPIERRKSGEFTIMLITGLTDISRAKEVAEASINAGFTGAHIVKDVNGKLEKVQ